MIEIVKKEQDCGYIWMDVTAPTEQELRELISTYKLHEPSVMDCLQPEHLPKYEEIEDLTFMILRAYDSHAEQEADTIQELSRKVAIFYTKSLVITIHRSEMPAVSTIKSSSKYSKKCNSALMSVFYLIQNVLQSYVEPGRKLVADLDQFETDIFLKKEMPHILKKLYHLKRKAAVSKRILHLSKDIIDQLDHHDIPETLLQDLRELFIRIETMYDEVLDGSNHLLNIYISLSSQKTNEVVRVLTVFSVFFMPLTFIAGIYGMNFDFMPELRMKFGYPGVLIFMVMITGVIYLWFKRKGWL
jgi:magnesium transporter